LFVFSQRRGFSLSFAPPLPRSFFTSGPIRQDSFEFVGGGGGMPRQIKSKNNHDGHTLFMRTVIYPVMEPKGLRVLTKRKAGRTAMALVRMARSLARTGTVPGRSAAQAPSHPAGR
jgi:hypothetical protein